MSKGKNKKEDKITWIGAISDLHVGSSKALFPLTYTLENTTLGEPETKKASTLQKTLFNTYSEMLQTWSKVYGTLDRTVMVGDMIQGNARFNAHEDLTVSNILEQCGAAVQLIKMIDTKRLNFITGTGAHVRFDGVQYEAEIASRLPNVEKDMNGNWASASWDLPMCKNAQGRTQVINFAHHVGETSSALFREINGAIQAERDRPDIRFEMLVRAHVHVPRGADESGMKIVTLPAWQAAASDFMQRINRFAGYTTKVGGYVIGYNEAGIVAIHPYIYNLHLLELTPRAI